MIATNHSCCYSEELHQGTGNKVMYLPTFWSLFLAASRRRPKTFPWPSVKQNETSEQVSSVGVSRTNKETSKGSIHGSSFFFSFNRLQNAHNRLPRQNALAKEPAWLQCTNARTVVAMTEVEAGNVHTSVDELLELGDLPTGGANGANDLGAAVEEGSRLLHGFKLDEAAGQGGYVGCVADHCCCWGQNQSIGRVWCVKSAEELPYRKMAQCDDGCDDDDWRGVQHKAAYTYIATCM
jgi:hypothetical protein